MSYFAFKALACRYREASNTEISAFAMQTSYTEYLKGNKTVLLRKIENYFEKSIDECLTNSRAKIEDSENTRKKQSHAWKKDFSNVHESILDPSKNSSLKLETALIAKENGKEYFLEKCHRHGETLFRIRSSTKPSKNASYCCICKYGYKREDEIKRAIKKFLDSRQAAPKN
ncbi:hypothetical protein QPK82_13575 [Acinetobacter baumannii]|uniref:hypothetical protein n=1 Tax=Acinetobacter baumannii TaxID=470 RepID=UPI00189A00E8|nr:hypothetical protein [Acinetobacter baumannii]MBF6833671.1 hypothetical protein [Acinetobacter baumannii]MDK3064923.1 hypothetical protein [Acinetobacter baumannii]